MIDAPEIIYTTQKFFAFLPLRVPTKEIRTHMGPGISEVLAAVAAQGLQHDGAWFTHHNHPPDEFFDFRICVPVKTTFHPQGRVQAGELPATRVARTIYRGGYEGLGAGWGELMKWMIDNGLKYRADLWEAYLKDPSSGESTSQWQTELNRPLA